jgi:hypothetical protein
MVPSLYNSRLGRQSVDRVSHAPPSHRTTSTVVSRSAICYQSCIDLHTYCSCGSIVGSASCLTVLQDTYNGSVRLQFSTPSHSTYSWKLWKSHEIAWTATSELFWLMVTFCQLQWLVSPSPSSFKSDLATYK